MTLLLFNLITLIYLMVSHHAILTLQILRTIAILTILLRRRIRL